MATGKVTRTAARRSPPRLIVQITTSTPRSHLPRYIQSEHLEANAARLSAFLSGPLEWTPFDDEDAREAGIVRAELERAGTNSWLAIRSWKEW
jgi:predicted nucleic acid-binding protein